MAVSVPTCRAFANPSQRGITRNRRNLQRRPLACGVPCAAMLRRTVLVLLLGLTLISLAWYVREATPAGTGLAAKQLCSLTFVSRLQAERAIRLYVRPLIGPLAPFLRTDIDPVTRRVRTDVFGMAPAIAVNHPGYGCIQLHEKTAGQLDQIFPVREYATPVTWGRNIAHRQASFDSTSLSMTMDNALAIPGTMAVVVTQAGELVAERYARGVDGDTPLPGWSMGKTVTAVLAGMLARRGLLRADEVALFESWENDDRVHISMDNLLRMTSGIDIIENKTGADANSAMLFKTGDAGGYAEARGLRRRPGERFDYTSGSTMLAARVITQRLGGPAPTLSFIRRELFQPLQMRSTRFEPDENGQFIGSSFIMASAHDWARFGQLLLRRGEVNGERYVDETWIDYMTTPTPQATRRPYGAGVWLVDPASDRNTWMHGLPADAYYASGLQTNQLWIIPSHELVIVRLGATSDFFESGVVELVKGMVAAHLNSATEVST